MVTLVNMNRRKQLIIGINKIDAKICNRINKAKQRFFASSNEIALFLCVCMHVKLLQSCPALCDPMDCIACQAPLSMGFCPSTPECHFLLRGIFLMQGPASFMSPALASGFCTISATWETPSFCMKVKMLVTQSCPTLRHHGLQPARLLCPWDSPGKNTGVPQVSFIAGRFLTV